MWIVCVGLGLEKTHILYYLSPSVPKTFNCGFTPKQNLVQGTLEELGEGERQEIKAKEIMKIT